MSEEDSPKYKRILLKLSGEALMGSESFGLDPVAIQRICEQILEIKNLNLEIGLVVGGGTICRGQEMVKRGMDRVTADNMGMMATVINSLALMDYLESLGVYTKVMSAVKMEDFA